MTNANLRQDFRYSAIPTTSTSGSGVNHSGRTLSYSGDLHRLRSGPLQYHVDPFADENGRLANEAASTGGVTTPPACPPPASGPQQLYHDRNTEIVELPPQYPRNTSPNDQSHTDTSDGSRTRIREPWQLQLLGKSGLS